MPQITIRKAGPADAEVVGALVAELDAVFAGGHDLSPAAVEKTLTVMEARPEVYCNYLAEEDGKALGFVSTVVYKTLFHHGATMLINELVVSAGARGKGIGKLLLEAMTELARQLQLDEIKVGTTTDNSAAISFYKKNGLVDVSVLLGRELQE